MRTVREVLEAGGTFHYAPLSGALMLVLDGKPVDDVEFTMLDFVNMKSDGTLKHTGTMRQGHYRFHGLVEFFELNK